MRTTKQRWQSRAEYEAWRADYEAFMDPRSLVARDPESAVVRITATKRRKAAHALQRIVERRGFIAPADALAELAELGFRYRLKDPQFVCVKRAAGIRTFRTGQRSYLWTAS